MPPSTGSPPSPQPRRQPAWPPSSAFRSFTVAGATTPLPSWRPAWSSASCRSSTCPTGASSTRTAGSSGRPAASRRWCGSATLMSPSARTCCSRSRSVRCGRRGSRSARTCGRSNRRAAPLALAGANIIANPSASPELLGKAEYRTELVRQQSARSMAAYCYAGAGPGESTMDVVYGGHSLICENGTERSSTRRFEFTTQLRSPTSTSSGSSTSG